MIGTHNPYALYEDRATCPLCSTEPNMKATPEAHSCHRTEPQVLNTNNVYVSNLLPELNEAWLRKEFSRFGLITSAKIMMKNGVSKGYGFVQFTEPEMANLAVQTLNGSYVGEHCISCKLADRDKDRGAQNQPSNNLYVGNLPTSYGVGEVSELFGTYGPISSLVVLSDPVTGGSRGVSLVRFHTVEDATKCITALHGIVLQGHDRPLEVKYAETSTEKHQRKSGKKRNPAPKRAANGRNRGRTTAEARTPTSRTRRENSPTSANAGRSSSNSSASNGTVEAESPVSLGPAAPSGPSAAIPVSHFPVDFLQVPRPPSAPSAPKAPVQAPQVPVPHTFLLRPTTMIPMRTPPPAMCKPPAINPGHIASHLGHPAPNSALTDITAAAAASMYARTPDLPVQRPPILNRGALLKVSGLPPACDEVSLYKIFTPYGAVESVSMPNAGVSPMAYVRFQQAKDAAVAVSHLQGAVMEDRSLQVEFQSH
eukprot:EG_transcript_2099